MVVSWRSMTVITPRHVARIALALVGLFVFWRVQNGDDKLYVFLFYIVGLFVEEFAMSAFREPKQKPGAQAGSNSYPFAVAGEAYAPTRGGRPEPSASAFADTVSIFVVMLVLAIMGDCAFFTDWLVLADPGDPGESGWITLVKIILNLAGFGVAFLGPLVAATVFWSALSDASYKTNRGPLQTDALGCLAVLPSLVVGALGYGHFFLAYWFYNSIGALAHT
ncbi:hypothetical protein Aglo01_46900 [Actinokineospora globicatena]|nr:hypothetical protein Aglo01_46900 [Actinokineospora globicatena]GLW87038.1 hypothetical protein Aglo02_46770 [Actinokineospora globicatena]